MNDEGYLTGKQLAEDINAFLETRLGKHFISELSRQYNDFHHAAESEELSVEQKALKIERAAGLKWAIDYLSTRNERFREGYWTEDESGNSSTSASK